jgi:GMP synthase (glutamine-hydrolysing)
MAQSPQPLRKRVQMSQIVVLNAGGQYCHLIARRIRELGVHASVADIEIDLSQLDGARGIIISGGPHSVRHDDSPRAQEGLYDLRKPILGICYGHQMIARDLGGEVESGVAKEYGETEVQLTNDSELLKGIGSETLTVWMSHGDTVTKLPYGYVQTARTVDCEFAGMENRQKRIFGLQFHPEVAHTTQGDKILQRFVFDIAGCTNDWNPRNRVTEVVSSIQQNARDRGIFFLISGGIDSTVAFQLCLRALGPDRVRGLYVDTGFMRKSDNRDLLDAFAGVEQSVLHITDRSEDFLSAIAGQTSPEKKRQIIGDLFMRVQEEEFSRLNIGTGDWLLGQGTIYPDTIESGGGRHSAKIKTHHNRVERVQQLIAAGRVIEPLAEFYKDEVRMLAEELKLPHSVVHKHPFPGPGLAVRCLCSDVVQPVPVRRLHPSIISKPSVAGISAWIVPVRTVGVQGDERSYSEMAAVQGPTLDLGAAGVMSRGITNEVRSINRVTAIVYTSAEISFDRFSIHSADVNRTRLELLRWADDIVTNIVRESGWYRRTWQFPVALLPLGASSTGETVVLRPVRSRDGMTADFVPLPSEIVIRIVTALAQRPQIECILYDVTNKPPATIELE